MGPQLTKCDLSPFMDILHLGAHMKRTLFIAMLGFLALGVVAVPDARAADAVAVKDASVYEIRTYRANPGRMEALQKHMREKSLPLFKKHGLTPIGFWVPKDQPNTLIYILVFKDMATYEKAVAAYFADPEAGKALAESQKDGPLLAAPPERLVAFATDYSPLH